MTSPNLEAEAEAGELEDDDFIPVLLEVPNTLSPTGPTLVPLGFEVLPTGMEPGDTEASSFSLKVTYRGTYVHLRHGGEPTAWYSVDARGVMSLSRAGRWAFDVPPFRVPQYRFTLEEAQKMALKYVDTVVVGRFTWEQFQVWRAKQNAMSSSANLIC